MNNKKTCPFISSIMLVASGLTIGSDQPHQKAGVAEVGCIEHRCMFWNNNYEDCNINVIAHRLKKLSKELNNNGGKND